MKILSILCTILLLSGCGFRLRGETQLPFSKVMVTGHPFEAIVRELTHQLKGARHLAVVDRIEDAQVVVDILDVRRDEEVLTISRAGHVQEYEYFLDVTYRLCGVGGKTCQNETTLKLVRQMTYDEGQILAKRNEERFLRKYMEQEAIRLILLRMSRFQVNGQQANGQQANGQQASDTQVNVQPTNDRAKEAN